MGTRAYHHNVPGGWIERLHGFRESPRPAHDPSERNWDGAPEEFDFSYGGDCETEHTEPDGKLFGPDSIFRMPKAAIVDTAEPE